MLLTAMHVYDVLSNPYDCSWNLKDVNAAAIDYNFLLFTDFPVNYAILVVRYSVDLNSWRMKGGIHGLKVSQASLILVGVVCATALVFYLTNTTFLASFFPSGSGILQLKRENSSLQAEMKEAESPGSLQIEPAVKSGNTANVISDKGGRI